MTHLPAAPAFDIGGGQLLVTPVGVLHLARAVEAAERASRLNGWPPPVEWVRLREAVESALVEARAVVTFASETAKARSQAAMPGFDRVTPPSGWIGTERVAEILRCSSQWARALLRRGEFATARYLGSCWTVDQDEVVAWAAVRAGHDRAAA